MTPKTYATTSKSAKTTGATPPTRRQPTPAEPHAADKSAPPAKPKSATPPTGTSPTPDTEASMPPSSTKIPGNFSHEPISREMYKEKYACGIPSPNPTTSPQTPEAPKPLCAETLGRPFTPLRLCVKNPTQTGPFALKFLPRARLCVKLNARSQASRSDTSAYPRPQARRPAAPRRPP